MVLDKFDQKNDMLIFKNKYDDTENGQPKKFEIRRTDSNAPGELYFVHIEVKDINGLPSQKERHKNKKEEIKLRERTFLKRFENSDSYEKFSESKTSSTSRVFKKKCAIL